MELEPSTQVAAALIGAVVMIILISYFAFTQHKLGNLTSKKLPPLANMTSSDVTRHLVEGNLHRYFLEKVVPELGLVFRIHQEVGHHHFIVCDSTLAKAIFEGDSEQGIPAGNKQQQLKLLNKLTMNKPNILSKMTHGEGWDWARKGVAPAFSNTNLVKQLPEIQRKLAEFTDVMDTFIAEDKLMTDFPSWMVKLTIDFISTTMFSQDFHTIKSTTSDSKPNLTDGMTDGEVYVTKMPIATKEFIVSQMTDLKRRLMFWKKENREAWKAARQINKVGHDILGRYRTSHTAAEIETDSTIIGHLIRSPYPTEIERVADVTIFMLAGHDTTAFQLSWIIIELARNPDIVKKLREELDSCFGELGPRNCTAQQLSQLDYLGKVIKEGMRLWPVVANGGQRVTSVDIPYGDCVIPAGSTLGINNFIMMRLGIHDGHEFIPERWNDEDPDREKLKESFMPFSSGRRNCIGQALALLELKLVIATLFYSYDFEVIGEFKEQVSLTMKPIGADIRVSRRKLA